MCIARDQDGIVIFLNSDGRIPLHLAAAKGRVEAMKCLLGIKNVKDQANVKNKNGSTALDVVEHYPNRHLKTMEIRELLVKASVRRSICGGPNPNPDLPPYDNYPPPPRHGRCKVRGHLITTATLTATIAYQAILSPPGGFRQDSDDLNQANPPAPFYSRQYLRPHRRAGVAVMDRNYNFALYLVINTLVLLASLSTIMLALSGFPLHNKFLLWLLIFTMYTTISCMAIAYFISGTVRTAAALQLSYCYTVCSVWCNGTFADASRMPLLGKSLETWLNDVEQEEEEVEEEEELIMLLTRNPAACCRKYCMGNHC
ncbi:hypothetical protein Vadar_024752 [Vaccinium darrowii]|uniref:Uncharacterized protein n=1 Tax=Vaccinium darrowii TaxID=229202 RepID=A0ACB7XJN8_9ERIC|nr:hypothetical protein Vadar_024752 [Vaccinium darrowii]